MARRTPDGRVVVKGGYRGDMRARGARARGEGTIEQEEKEQLPLAESASRILPTDSERTLRLVWNQSQPKSKESEAISQWAKKLPRKRKPQPQKQEQTQAELESMLQSGQWSNARPAHLVTLYCLLHHKVYDVEALDLRGQLNRQAAARMALTMLQRDFDRDVASMVEYMRWSWMREEGREVWRRRNNTGRRRLTWRMQFGGELLTEYLMQRVTQA